MTMRKVGIQAKAPKNQEILQLRSFSTKSRSLTKINFSPQPVEMPPLKEKTQRLSPPATIGVRRLMNREEKGKYFISNAV
jgi:hypothetical protein